MTGGVQRFARLVEHKPIGRITVWKFKRREGVCDTVNRIRSFCFLCCQSRWCPVERDLMERAWLRLHQTCYRLCFSACCGSCNQTLISRPTCLQTDQLRCPFPCEDLGMISSVRFKQTMLAFCLAGTVVTRKHCLFFSNILFSVGIFL